MNLRKKYSFVSVMIVFVLMLTNLVLVDANGTMMDTAKYGLVTIEVNELPEGVVPIEIKDEEELMKVMEMIEENQKIITEKNGSEDIVYGSAKGDLTIMTTNEYVEGYKPLNLWVYNPFTGEVVWSLTRFKVWANFDVWKFDVPDLTIINKENTCGVSLSGLTLGMTISETEAFTTIASDNLSAYVRGDATLNYYLVINGLIQLRSIKIDHSFTYNPN